MLYDDFSSDNKHIMLTFNVCAKPIGDTVNMDGQMSPVEIFI
jgi:hypothetical protein